jgi:hypothetical protein
MDKFIASISKPKRAVSLRISKKVNESAVTRELYILSFPSVFSKTMINKNILRLWYKGKRNRTHTVCKNTYETINKGIFRFGFLEMALFGKSTCVMTSKIVLSNSASRMIRVSISIFK